VVRYALAVLALTLVYALALASFHPWDLLIGASLSAALVFSFGWIVFEPESESGPTVRRPSLLRRVVAFVPFCLAVIWDILVGTWDVALVTLHLRPLKNPGIVVVPIGERSPTGVAVWALATTLSPGSYFVEVDREREVVLIHVIDARDPEAIREQHQDFYRRYQRKVFP
jgi:multicomponent Na+:H+ antiporter subunit E